ncbi:MAG: peptidase S41, partial [Sphingobacteriaceae bacterium]|nr:peptidase S41 [Cytophagaceae bacterium]
LTALATNGLLFDYANKYHHDHASIKPAREFGLSDAEYAEFVKWLTDKEYEYTTQVERDFATLEASAKTEKYYDTVQEQLASLRKKLSHSKEQDLQLFKDEVKYQLEQEIVVHYGLQKGLRELSFSKDPEIQAALKLFGDMPRYQAILKKAP